MNKKHFILLIAAVFFIKSPIISRVINLDSLSSIDFNLGLHSYYSNDQRIQWSGMEATFGTEAFLNTTITRKISKAKIQVISEIRLNQPFDDNMLVDDFRSKYSQNFKINRFDLTRLYIGYKSKTVEIFLGKKETNFGRDNLIHLFNSEFDLPFIRTESILLRETGVFFTLRKGVLNFSFALVNGGPEMDTNSSKSGIVRAGIDLRNFSAGVSAKFQDGIGSENQKEYKNHIGVDFLLKTGNIKVAGEFIYDQYGFRKDYNPDSIFWRRSLYSRDIFFKSETPITGIGGYIDIQYRTGKIILNGNYGEFYPKQIGVPSHDEPVRRAIVKILYDLPGGFGLFAGSLIENDRPVDPVFSGRSGYAFYAGASFNLK